MTVNEVFDLRKQGKIEEAYEAIRPMYAVHQGKYTTLCMFWTASDILKKRIEEKRIEEAENIFGRFVKLDSFKQGIGLGLPLSRKLAEQLGGTVTLDTSYHPGARFVVTLPIDRKTLEQLTKKQ